MLVLSLTSLAELEHDLGHFQQARETLTEAGQLADANTDRAAGPASTGRRGAWTTGSGGGLAAARCYRELGRSPYEVRAAAGVWRSWSWPPRASRCNPARPAGRQRHAAGPDQHGLLARLVAAVRGEPVDLLIAQIPELLADNDNRARRTADATLAELHWQAGNAETAIGHWRDALRTLDGIDEPRQRAGPDRLYKPDRYRRPRRRRTTAGPDRELEPRFRAAQLQRRAWPVPVATPSPPTLANTLRQLTAPRTILAAELAASVHPPSRPRSTERCQNNRARLAEPGQDRFTEARQARLTPDARLRRPPDAVAAAGHLRDLPRQRFPTAAGSRDGRAP